MGTWVNGKVHVPVVTIEVEIDVISKEVARKNDGRYFKKCLCYEFNQIFFNELKCNCVNVYVI